MRLVDYAETMVLSFAGHWQRESRSGFTTIDQRSKERDDKKARKMLGNKREKKDEDFLDRLVVERKSTQQNLPHGARPGHQILHMNIMIVVEEEDDQSLPRQSGNDSTPRRDLSCSQFSISNLKICLSPSFPFLL